MSKKPLVRFLSNDARRLMKLRRGNEGFDVSDDGSTFLVEGRPVSDIKALQPMIELAVLQSSSIGIFLAKLFGPDMEREVVSTPVPVTAEDVGVPSLSFVASGVSEKSQGWPQPEKGVLDDTDEGLLGS
jgi:hypothetical protein